MFLSYLFLREVAAGERLAIGWNHEKRCQDVHKDGSTGSPAKTSNVPMIVGRVRPTPPKINRLTDSAYPRPFAIILEENPERAYSFLLATLGAQFNKTTLEAQYILKQVEESGSAVVEICPNKDLAESRLLLVNDRLAFLGQRPLAMDLAIV